METRSLPDEPDVAAPDGSDVRVLLGVAAGGMAHFELAAGQTSVAVAHRTVEEIWYFLRGHGEMWRRLGDDESVVAVEAGVSASRFRAERRFSSGRSATSRLRRSV